MNEEEQSEEFGEPDAGISVITIVLDENDYSPKIELGDVPPLVAISIFQRAVEILDQFMPDPVISFNGQEIWPDPTMIADHYEDDWDD